jgi:hypothetical protein
VGHQLQLFVGGGAGGVQCGRSTGREILRPLSLVLRNSIIQLAAALRCRAQSSGLRATVKERQCT